MNILQITPAIACLEHTEDPLSSDAFIISDDGKNVLFDVGANQEFLPLLQTYSSDASIVISHFHQDHIGNLPGLTYQNIYFDRQTYEKMKFGHLVLTQTQISRGTTVIPISSSHTKTALCLLHAGYLFAGDALYAGKGMYNVQKLSEMISVLEPLDFRWFVISHGEPLVLPKEEGMEFLKEIFQKREKSNPWIKI